VIAAVPLGLAIGMTMGALGGGGAVLAVPILVYVLAQDPHPATTASLVIVAAGAIGGGVGQVDRGQVCWPQVAVFAPAAVVGALAGTVANESADGSSLLVAFAVVMLGASAFMWRRADAPEEPDASCPPLRSTRTAAAGLAVGAATGFFGVGGGFLVVPMLALAMRFPLRRAIGTSLVIVAFVSLVALAMHLALDADIDIALTALMAAGCAAGGVAGARLAGRIPRAALGHAFSVLVALVALYVIAAEATG
jgi:uncharacterized membrane protein YfcA